MSESTTAPASNNITLEAIEQLAADMLAGETARRERLLRLIRAYARILSVRETQLFVRRHVEISDEDGHWDNSYPPEQKRKNFSGPKLLQVAAYDYETIATSSGFYHDWKAVTSDRGLYVSGEGTIYGADVTGTGHFGQYAAHPGDDNVQIEIEWSSTALDELPTSDLDQVEQHLRRLTFPLTVGAAK